MRERWYEHCSRMEARRRLILPTIEDVTDRRAAEREIAELLQQKETLLQEMQHRGLKLRHIPLAIAQSVNRTTLNVLTTHPERLMESAVCSDDTQALIEN